MKRASKFYDAALQTLGYVRVWADETAVGYGYPGGGDKFAIKARSGEVLIPGEGFHAAFVAPSRAAVIAFHRAGITHGGSDNGGAGLHPEYGPDYYAAFVFDPDGHRIEAVIKGASNDPRDPTA